MAMAVILLALPACDENSDGGSDPVGDDAVDAPKPEEPCDWAEGEVLHVRNQAQYNWAVKQRNVLMVFVEYYANDPMLDMAFTVMMDHLPWFWVAKVEWTDVPEVFANEDVVTIPTMKFYSFGVEMEELALEGSATLEQVEDGAKALKNRYEPDVLVPQTYDELMEMVCNPATPVMVKFGAEWCPPCQYMVPRLELASIEYGDELVDEYGDFIRDEKLLTIVEVDIDVITDAPAAFGFQYIPYFLFYDNGEEYDDYVGGMPYEMLKDMVDDFLFDLE